MSAQSCYHLERASQLPGAGAGAKHEHGAIICVMALQAGLLLLPASQQIRSTARRNRFDADAPSEIGRIGWHHWVLDALLLAFILCCCYPCTHGHCTLQALLLAGRVPHSAASTAEPGSGAATCRPAAASAAAPGAGLHCAVQSVTGLKLLYHPPLLSVLQASSSRGLGQPWQQASSPYSGSPAQSVLRSAGHRNACPPRSPAIRGGDASDDHLKAREGLVQSLAGLAGLASALIASQERVACTMGTCTETPPS